MASLCFPELTYNNGISNSREAGIPSTPRSNFNYVRRLCATHKIYALHTSLCSQTHPGTPQAGIAGRAGQWSPVTATAAASHSVGHRYRQAQSQPQAQTQAQSQPQAQA